MFRFSPRPNRASEIHWHAWSADTFALAAAADRLVLLSLSAIWCHWCHVMDETTYSDDAVISLVNERFIAIRVDTDERPDINLRYNMGGWPTTAILTSDGAILSGATYVPAETMPALLERVSAFYSVQRERISEHLAQARSARDARLAGELPVPTELDPAIAGEIMSTIIENFDEEHGGFGSAPKFPQTDVLAFMLATWRVARMEEQRASRREIRAGVVTTKAVFTAASMQYEAMLRKSLTGMIYGGLYDLHDGGFYRYSTQADWSTPHYEKITEEQAGLLTVIAGVYRITRDDDLARVLQRTRQWIFTTLYDAQTHLFANSQDADETYSVLDEIARKERRPPFVDTKRYSYATAALAGALFHVADVLEDNGIAEYAVRALDALHERLLDDSGLLRHDVPVGDAPSSVERLLLDQVAYLQALIDAYEYGGEARFLDRACVTADAVLTAFLHDGRLCDHAHGDGTGALSEFEYPIRENANTAEALLRLAALTGQTGYHEAAAGLLRAFAQEARAQSLFAAAYAKALARALSPVSTLRIVAGTEAARAFRHEAQSLPDPYLAVRTEETADEEGVAYLCRAGTCAAPTHGAAALRASWDWVLLAS